MFEGKTPQTHGDMLQHLKHERTSLSRILGLESINGHKRSKRPVMVHVNTKPRWWRKSMKTQGSP